MKHNTEIDCRLKAEAQFQNRKVQTEQMVKTRTKFYPIARTARARYRSLLDDVKERKVLIVGCSEGGVTPLARKGAFVTGIDIAEIPIVRLNEAIKREGLDDRCSVMVMNAEGLDFSENTFDIIGCSGVLHHLDIERAAKCWARVLKTDGRIAMMEPMAWNPVVALYRFVTPFMRTRDEHPLTPRDIGVLKKYFQRVEIEGFVLTSVLSIVFVYLPVTSSIKKRFMRTLDKLDSWILRHCPHLTYFCWISVIQLFEPRKTDPFVEIQK
jgi:2-polyprenyl-3-methyl-5-hydroxy-6-metoxy-1,4-benzoquinol methylase